MNPSLMRNEGYGLSPGGVRSFERERRPPSGVRFLPASGLIAVALGGKLVLRDLNTGDAKHEMQLPEGVSFTSVWRLSQAGDLIACGGRNTGLWTLDLPSGETHEFALTADALDYFRAESPGIGSFGAIHYPDGSYEDRSRLYAAYSTPCDVSIGLNGTLIAAAYGQNYALLWDVPSKRLRYCLGGESGDSPARIYRIALNRNGDRAITCDSRGHVTLWDTQSARELRHLYLSVQEHNHPDSPDDMPSDLSEKGGTGAIAFSPDGTRMAAADGAVVRMWNVGSGEELGSLIGHESHHPIMGEYGRMPRIHDITFSADSRRAMTVGVDCTIRVWDVESSELIWAVRPDPCCIDHADLSPDGRHVVWAACPGTNLYALG